MITKLKFKSSVFFNQFQNWTKKQKSLFFLILFFSFLATFSTMSISGRFPLNYVNNTIYLILLLLISLFLFFYGAFRLDIYFLLLFLFNFFILVSSLLTGLKGFNFGTILVSITSFFIYQLLINLNEEKQKMLFNSFFIGGLFFSIYFFLYYFKIIINFDFSIRIGGYFNNLNEMAKYFVFLSLISFYLFLFKNKFEHLILFIVFSLFLIWTGSRSNLLSLIILILFISYFKFSGGQKKYFLYLLILFIFIGIFVLQMNFMAPLKKRLYDSVMTLIGINSGIPENILDFSTASRRRAFYEAFELFLQRPLFGYGYSGTNLYSFSKMSTHNNFVALLGNFGLPAFLIFETFLILPIFFFIKDSRKYKNSNLVLLSVSLVAYIFVFQLFLVNFYSKLEYFYLPFAYAQIFKSKQFIEIRFNSREKSL